MRVGTSVKIGNVYFYMFYLLDKILDLQFFISSFLTVIILISYSRANHFDWITI